MLRILLGAALIFFAMVALKQDHVLQRLGLTGYCNVVATPVGQDGSWHACRSGKLAGYPDLSRNSCTTRGIVGSIEYWQCPVAITQNAARQ